MKEYKIIKNYMIKYMKSDEDEVKTVIVEATSPTSAINNALIHHHIFDNDIMMIELIFKHDDEKYANDVVDEEILNGFVGAPN